jgi:hypothetical protein
MSTSYRHVGRVLYNPHPSTPLVVGDFEVMKGWEGDPDGNADGEIIDVGTGKVLTVDLHNTEVDLFASDDGQLVLMNEPEKTKGLLSRHSIEALQKPLNAAFTKTHGDWNLAIPSGALVINVMYNATPEEGAPTDHLDETVWYAELPRLPKTPPTTIVNTFDVLDHRGLAIVPVRPGTYSFVQGEVPEGFYRMVIRRSGK